ncbi:Arc family DNA-binding protein [Pseudomonas sp. PDM18]|uniref:Arc family DNA-binding protein n=1 Tax=Pseudomonas sp. PDM18 TaxID=2769253 RepID=UPI00177C9100|nr:Arc family DNA-binding protein [Pseudomonas sp. PDM18]MBD9675528.1 Arc family DNA-binding protein [Pseudomonas sp. PDM18]
MKQTDPQYKLRIPEDVKSALEEAAKESKRSLNAEIVARLERSIEADKIGLTADLMDTLALQAILTLTLLNDLDTEKMSGSQLLAIDGLRQVSERVAKRLQINKKSPYFVSVVKDSDD